jgi:hypothetical protein
MINGLSFSIRYLSSDVNGSIEEHKSAMPILSKPLILMFVIEVALFTRPCQSTTDIITPNLPFCELT